MTFNQVATKTTPRRWNMAVESNNNLSSHLVDRTSGFHLHHKTIARTSTSAGNSSYRFKTFHNNFTTHKKRKQPTSTCALLGLTFFPIVPFFRHFGKVAKRFLVCAMASLWYSSHHSRRRPVSCQGHRMLRGFDSNWQWVKNHIASALHIHEFLSNLPFFDQHAVGPNIWRI